MTSEATVVAPDWSMIDRDIACPLCGYNLRGLVEPRCPECGYAFEWGRILAPHAQHPYLFEHHPRRNVWSFSRTLLAQLRPARFWTTLEPLHEIDPRRLVLYWVLAASLILIGYVPLLVGYIYRNFGEFVFQSWWDVIDVAVFNRRDIRMAWSILFWPWLTFTTMLIFQQSLAPVRVRTPHVLRVAIYCGDGVFWCALILTILTPLIDSEDPWWGFIINGQLPGMLMGMVLLRRKLFICAFLAMFTGWRLMAACKYYLHIDHPRWVVIATQAIVFMFVVAIS